MVIPLLANQDLTPMLNRINPHGELFEGGGLFHKKYFRVGGLYCL